MGRQHFPMFVLLYHIGGTDAMEKTEKFTNEELVDLIKRGVDVTNNYEQLYEQNKPLIWCMVKPYSDSSGEDIADLMQESFFALIKAVEHYETSENVKFMSYAPYWIRRYAQHYIDKSGLIKIPSNMNTNIRKYKKACADYERDHGMYPSNADLSNILNTPPVEIDKIRSLTQGSISLDTPFTNADNLILANTLAADLDIESNTVDKVLDEQKKSELWGIVARCTTNEQNDILREIFLKNRTMSEIAREHGISLSRVRKIRDTGLQRLSVGKIKKELQEKFEILDSSIYRDSISTYRERSFTSTVEYIASTKADLQQEYQRRLSKFKQ
jgi:RNA polymerase sigma factor (sigma-70 family)